ncbi:hypothetical protein SAMN04487828_0548 [Prevotella sp. lc2012]|nr:hypothetical protein SAMN04487828_0548 [Prevotella sp. lc2012]
MANICFIIPIYLFIILFSIACNDISMKLLFEKIPYIHNTWFKILLSAKI